MDRTRSGLGGLGLTMSLAVITPAFGHVVLDPEIAGAMLVAIAGQLKASREAPAEDARVEALYLLGERVHQLVEMMNTDVLAHEQSLYGQLMAQRLSDLGIRIVFVDRSRRYFCDLAPFEQYLQRAPRGPRAADVKFRLITETFHRSLGTRPGDLAEGNVETLAQAVRREEAFIADHPSDPRLREVRFFLAIDYYRLHRNSPDPQNATKYRALARTALKAIIRDYPGTTEARSAEPRLEELR
jgi:hypothetical protein